MRAAQLQLFAFLAAVAIGTIVGGPLGDRFGRKYVIWLSIVGTLPFALLLPNANVFWLADAAGINAVYRLCAAYLPLIGLIAAFLPNIATPIPRTDTALSAKR